MAFFLPTLMVLDAARVPNTPRIGMPDARPKSSEADGVKCLECGCGLPRNNWDFEHTGNYSNVIVFYADRKDDVQVTDTFNAGVTFDGKKGGLNAGYEQAKTMRDVKVMEYIRNKMKTNGYTCLNCLNQNCLAGYQGWDLLLREVNSLLRKHDIKVETARFQADGSYRY